MLCILLVIDLIPKNVLRKVHFQTLPVMFRTAPFGRGSVQLQNRSELNGWAPECPDL
jgi:hypothetical protein